MSTLQDVIPLDIPIHGYADDHSVKKAFRTGCQNNSKEKKAIGDLENVTKNIKSWMDLNRLNMNDGKTEFALFRSRQQLAKCISESMKMNRTRIDKSEVIEYLGVYLHATLSIKTHTTNKRRMAMLNLLNIRNIEMILTVDACKTLVESLVILQLHLSRTARFYHKEIQTNTNITSEIILSRFRYNSTTECMEELHWLPARSRMKHKILTLVHKIINRKAPSYPQELLEEQFLNRRNLRSSRKIKHLKVPFTKRKMFESRSFSVIGPSWWNELPNKLKQIEDAQQFKKQLKTHLFREVYVD